jgi:hypothetical protein
MSGGLHVVVVSFAITSTTKSCRRAANCRLESILHRASTYACDYEYMEQSEYESYAFC